MFTARSGRAEVVALLLAKGADRAITNNGHATAAALAARGGCAPGCCEALELLGGLGDGDGGGGGGSSSDVDNCGAAAKTGPRATAGLTLTNLWAFPRPGEESVGRCALA